ncbi:MAG: DUF1501 domain-containing protein [Planctomycetaceae bacterium]|nr:DUF1501 domain-containing protein [Planctomycetaceae bacterium]
MDRRQWFRWTQAGLGGAALSSLLMRDGIAQSTGSSEESATHGIVPHQAPKAKRAIHICLCGGFSHIDTFDYKPELSKRHGTPLTGDEKPDVFFGKVGLLRKNDWNFKQRGESGLWVSDLFPHLSQVADELTVIRSMVAKSSSHTPATFQENTGFRLNGFPVVGAWMSYGLGSETDELPAYVVLPDTRGYPAGGTTNWTNGFLPAQHQGVVFKSNETVIDNLQPARAINAETDAASRVLLQQLNQQHLQDRGQKDDLLDSRIRSYALAAKMQLAVPQVTNLGNETKATLEDYGMNGEATKDFGRSCLMARRLLENGVRFVQLFSGGSFGSPRINWDGHEDMLRNHNREAQRIDQPVAALIRDLKQRGMLEDTLLLFTSEFGRTPFTQSAANEVGKGRDHNQTGFSVWMAGGGLKPGFAYGATDEVGWKAVENPVSWYDFHATVLHLLGINHKQLTYYHNGIQRRLTDVHGHRIDGILA